MIDKKILFSLVLLAFFAGCNAGENIQDVIDDTKDLINNDDDMVSDGIVGNITQDIKDLLIVHNEARKEVGVESNLTWSDTISKDAQKYADILAASGAFEHDPRNNPIDKSQKYSNGIYGENLYAITRSTSLKEAAEAWVNEKQYYTYGAVVDSSVEADNTCVDGVDEYGNKILCGHYTQIIWKNTTLVGCAKSQYTKGTYRGGYVVVCKYQRPGNYIGQAPY